MNFNFNSLYSVLAHQDILNLHPFRETLCQKEKPFMQICLSLFFMGLALYFIFFFIQERENIIRIITKKKNGNSLLNIRIID